jgi:hypothetical protein
MQKGSTPPRPGMLTHDIEGAFINTHPSLLDDVLRMRTMPTYLRNWVRAFNQDRRLGFGLDGCSDDDVNIVVSCPRLDDMVRALQGRTDEQIERASHLKLSLAPGKSELILGLPATSKYRNHPEKIPPAQCVTAHEGLRLEWWIMVAARICARACFFWSLISLVRLSLWSAYSLGYLRGLVAVDLPGVVRFDVARGTRGIVVWVNVVRVLCCCVGVAYMRGMPTVFGFLSFLSLSRNLLSTPRPTKSATDNTNHASQTTKAFLCRLFFIF